MSRLTDLLLLWRTPPAYGWEWFSLYNSLGFSPEALKGTKPMWSGVAACLYLRPAEEGRATSNRSISGTLGGCQSHLLMYHGTWGVPWTPEWCSTPSTAESEGEIMALLGTKLSLKRHFLACTQHWRNDQAFIVFHSGIYQCMSTDRDDQFSESTLKYLSPGKLLQCSSVLLEVFILGC